MPTTGTDFPKVNFKVFLSGLLLAWVPPNEGLWWNYLARNGVTLRAVFFSEG